MIGVYRAEWEIFCRYSHFGKGVEERAFSHIWKSNNPDLQRDLFVKRKFLTDSTLRTRGTELPIRDRALRCDLKRPKIGRSFGSSFDFLGAM